MSDRYVGSPQPTVLTVVSSLDPVRFDFTISEAEYLALARTAKAKAGERAKDESRLELVLADGSVHPYKGRVTVVGRGVERRNRHAAPAGQLPESGRACFAPASSAGYDSRSPHARTRS